MARKLKNTIIQGDTAGVWLISHDLGGGVAATLDSSYTCVLAVKGSTIHRSVLDKNAENTKFLAFLTPIETASLAVGTHLVGLQLANNALIPPLRREVQIELEVSEQVVP